MGDTNEQKADFWRPSLPAFKMGMWWEIVLVGGIMVGIHQAFNVGQILRAYGFSGRAYNKSYLTDQQWNYHTRDTCHSYPTFLSKRRYMRHVNEGNFHYNYGLEKIPDAK